MTETFNFKLPLNESEGSKAIEDIAKNIFKLNCTEPRMYERVHESGWKIKSAWTITVKGDSENVIGFLNQVKNKFNEVQSWKNTP